MKIVSFAAISYSKNLTFNFSNTKRNENVNLSNYSSSNYVIDINGTVYLGSSPSEDSATITIIGGNDTFINEKATRLESNFYLSEPQKVVLYGIMREHCKWGDTAEITSDNDKLEQSLNALFRNYCG